MCGISVSYATDNASPSSATALQAQVDQSISAITHRGPDSTGTYVSPDGRVAMGHVRLSIIDLVTGQQPLHDDDYNVHVVVTGELYDYERIRAELEAKGSHFKTNSDSELVVHLYKCYGFNLLTWLRGEFAFVLYDSRRDLLFAARDRFGIKPLYYSLVDGHLLISSEVKAMRAFGWKPEWDVESVVQMGDLNDDRTVFKGVFKVSLMCIDRVNAYQIHHVYLIGPHGPLHHSPPYWPPKNSSLLGPFVCTSNCRGNSYGGGDD
ncbi:hypothetical protein SERLA73DRAFT_51100 [Serpula lacrymans var. lacrymans S7.3]|uniref:Glutamine amidotransferase type-2 domain-containing protein n=1 Tax=Serpula lacrymans var. lacrymans (strain S7.3) TaxID=936435 RepID=F8PSJ1_SERL3|nr:hypothetical protein SERLA73DRAFT_51100 [Serpula lacrymans var. lacrymans S7.3]